MSANELIGATMFVRSSNLVNRLNVEIIKYYYNVVIEMSLNHYMGDS
jgi:hypothetical protein